jgi:hypothetical protein
MMSWIELVKIKMICEQCDKIIDYQHSYFDCCWKCYNDKLEEMRRNAYDFEEQPAQENKEGEPK